MMQAAKSAHTHCVRHDAALTGGLMKRFVPTFVPTAKIGRGIVHWCRRLETNERDWNMKEAKHAQDRPFS